MTDLSYTAWDDKKYQWPPPDGWYQAADGKWWPEGYGPVTESAGEATADAGAFDDTETETEVEAAAETTAAFDAFDAVSDDTEAETEVEAAVDHAAVDAFSSPDGNGFDDAAAVTADVDAVHEEVLQDLDLSAEPVVEAEEVAPVNGIDVDSDLDVESDLDVNGSSDLSDAAEIDVVDPVDAYASESSYSASSAGMAASGFGSRTEGGASSFGLAGWAQAGGAEVRSHVDVGHEYDYTPPESDTEAAIENLVDEVTEADERADEQLDDLASADSTAADSENGLGSGTLGTATEPVDSTLSRLDDLKRQVEEQSFGTPPAAADATTPIADLDLGGLDPTETLDIDPNDLSIETNPYYGGGDDSSGFDSTGFTSAPSAETTEVSDLDDGSGTDHGFVERRAARPEETFGYSPVSDETVEMPPPSADAPSVGYDDAAMPPPGSDQPIPMADGYGAPQNDYQADGPLLSPMSSPPPKPGTGRKLLYALIGLLALAVAGAIGYLLFQLQSDDDGTEAGSAEAAAIDAGGDAGGSDTSRQEPGSFSNPHELAGGVRLTVPVADAGVDEVWMLQVREPASTSDLGGDEVEVTSRLRVRNDSTSGDLAASGLRFVLVSADGSSGTAAASSCSAGDDLNLQAPIEPGKDIVGNVCWTVPAAQATGALLGIESVHAGGRVHVQLS